MCKSHSSLQAPPALCVGLQDSVTGRPLGVPGARRSPASARPKEGPTHTFVFIYSEAARRPKKRATLTAQLVCYQKRLFSLRSAWRRALQRGDARFSLESQQAKSTPAPAPFWFQAVGAVEGRRESPGCTEVLKSLATLHPPNTGRCCSAEAKWKADLLLQFRTVFSEDAISDGKLRREIAIKMELCFEGLGLALWTLLY